MGRQLVEGASDALLDDYYRQGDHLTWDDFERVVNKRGLDDAESEAVLAALSDEGINLEEDAPLGFGVRNGMKASRRDSSSPDLVKMYLKEIGNHPLLDAQDEVRLGRRMRAGEQALTSIDEHGSTPELEERVRQGAEAFHTMVEANLRLVVSIAKRYVRQSSLDLLDLIQEGNLGLIRAVEKYDHTLGYKFSTYATWWIRQKVTRALADKGRLIRLPVHAHESLHRIRKVRVKLLSERGVEPTLSEIAEEIEMDPATVQYLLDASRAPVSLDMPVGDDEESTLGDLQSDPFAVGPEEQALTAALNEILEETLASLTERERYVLETRYGLRDGIPQTLEQIGQSYELTRERIRQIQSRALETLRGSKVTRQLEEFLNA